jgi:hypothetical protein
MKAKPKKKPAAIGNRRLPRKKTARARAVTRTRAVQIAVKVCTPDRRQFECFDAKPEGCRIFNAPAGPCGYILCPWGDGLDGRTTRSRRLVILSRRTGRVLYNGSAHDEG